MKAALAVGLGGLLGSLARYKLGVVAGLAAVWMGWRTVELLTR